jgi:UDP-glucose 4-epimerase
MLRALFVAKVELMKKILVTGGYGFIGARVVKHLRQKGLEVVILEHPAAPVRSDLADVQVIRADIADENSMSGARLKGIDAVLHFAAQSSGPRSFSIPVLDVKLNVLGTVNTINWCEVNQVDRLVIASSFVVYGDHPEREALDESVACWPKSVYATSKLAAENMLLSLAQPKGIRWNALRMFNVYGPGQDITKPDQGVVGIFMNMLIHSDRIQIKGSLDRFRDLIYIDDVIQGWDLCLHGTAYNRSFNLGTGDRTTYDSLIRSLARIMGKTDRLQIEELPGTPGDMKGCIADITNIKNALDYKPQYNLAEGLRQMWDWVNASKGI